MMSCLDFALPELEWREAPALARLPTRLSARRSFSKAMHVKNACREELHREGRQSAKEKRNLTAKLAKAAKEEKSFTAKEMIIRTTAKPEGREGTAPKVAYR